MGYSKNEAAINRVKALLDQMVTAATTKTDLSWPTKDAHMLGYHLREAMSLAKRIGKAPYHELKDQFTIRNRGDRVVAEIKNVEQIVALSSAMSKMDLPDIMGLTSIVGAAITYDTTSELYFPNAVLTDEELNQLYLWAEPRNYYLVVAEVGITLTKNDPGDAKWTP